MKLVGMQIESNEEFFRTTLKAGGVMDVVEQYPWTGEQTTHKRRDKRAGHHTGRVVGTEEGPQLQCALPKRDFIERLQICCACLSKPPFSLQCSDAQVWGWGWKGD